MGGPRASGSSREATADPPRALGQGGAPSSEVGEAGSASEPQPLGDPAVGTLQEPEKVEE